MGKMDELGSPVAQNHGATPLAEVPGTVEGQTDPKRGVRRRLTAEEHFAIDQKIRSALAEFRRIDEIMEVTGLSRAAVFRHLKHVRVEFRKWLDQQEAERHLLLYMATLDGLEGQVRYLIEAEKGATTASDKAKLALSIMELENAIAGLTIGVES
jgi:hypothetical protein